MPLPLEIATTPRAHDAQINEVTEFIMQAEYLRSGFRCVRPGNLHRSSRRPIAAFRLGRMRRCTGQIHWWKQQYYQTSWHNYLYIYSQDSNDPKIVNLELIAVREKYRLRQVGTQLMEIVKREARLLGAIQLQTQAPQKMPGLQSFLAKMVSITVTWKRARAGFCFCGIKKILRIRRYKLLGNYNAQSKFIRSHCAIKWLSILRWY